MHLRVYLLLLFWCFHGSSAGSTDPMQVALRQAITIYNAVEVEDYEVVKELVKTTKDDGLNIYQFVRGMQEVSINVKNAGTNSDGSILAQILLANKIPGEILLTKNPQSMTGWRISLMKLKVNSTSLK